MSEEIKVGDWVMEKSNPNSGVFKVLEIDNDTLKIETTLSPCKFDINNLKKVYVYDTPQITQTEVEIKGGHLAGYGVDKFSIYDRSIDCVRYDNGLAFNWNDKDEKWTLRYKNHLPHEQEDLKHLFE
tara:strand:+ start:229 stop:609 length:381 start_codon:yes stop_codon:yes gene_type:complete